MADFPEFIASYSFDRRLASDDIRGSIAHVRMLVKRRILTAAEGKRIIQGLSGIAADLKKGKRLPPAEDIHFVVEQELIRRIGPLGGKMHTARSRNDQVAMDLRLHLRGEIGDIIDTIETLQKAIVKKADEYRDAVMPGYTHLQPAQPVLFAHYLLAYAWMFDRDKGRMEDCLTRMNVSPLGSAALAGTSFPIDRRMVAKELLFTGISENSIDGVSDRDYAVEFLAAASIAAMHLSRLAEELVVWSSVEFEFIRLADDFTSGSSIMPQKRNPDVAELIRGKTGRVYGDLVALLTTLKGLPLAYNRDMQEDKPPVFDAADTLDDSLAVMAEMIGTMEVFPDRMRQATEKGFLSATELADYLVRKGMPFRTAHGVVGDVVRYCISEGKTLAALSLGEFRKFSGLFDKDIYAAIPPEQVIKRKTSEGGTSPASVRRQIALLKKHLQHS